ncbi:uncharacterized protein L201_002387 [Kwoniella dendrophila CBS 6074]|uniref:DNA polymerase delta subunit 4 n=1 Tax=Kwoniella dendrophila CBS 6074 TaxID=1295534 RepID=A0AAX4JQ55_9TREE
MPPRKSTTASAGTTSRSKKAAGIQPTLSFQSARPSANAKKSKSGSKAEITSNTPSFSEIDLPIVHEIDLQSDVENQTKRNNSNTNNDEGLKVIIGKQGKLDVKSKQWKGVIRDAKIQMGGLEPIHAGPDTHNDIHHVLRVFDLTSSYGPCVGITRLQRWERAKKWGLNPPEEIRDILTTEEGQDDVRYRENVLYGWV